MWCVVWKDINSPLEKPVPRNGRAGEYNTISSKIHFPINSSNLNVGKKSILLQSITPGPIVQGIERKFPKL